MAEISFEPLHGDFAARVTGLSLANPLSSEQVAALHQAIDRYSFLCFPGQALDDAAHLAFTRQLGQPEAEHVALGKTGETIYLGTIGNVNDDGTKKDADHPHTRYQRGNELWHSDSSFRETPSYVTITHPHEVPGDGGATQFVSQRAAYGRLPEELRDRIEGLEVIHDYVFSRTQRAPVDFNHAASLPPVKHPLVITTPGTGARNYFVGSHARSVVGWRGIDSRRLLDDLLARVTRDQDIYSHHWSAGETVIWDNRCLLHRGTGFDADRWRRRLRQTRVVGARKGVL